MEGVLVFLLVWMLMVLGGCVVGLYWRGQPVWGALSGLAFGVFSPLLIFFMVDKRRHCDECRSVVPTDASRCKHCGASL